MRRLGLSFAVALTAIAFSASTVLGAVVFHSGPDVTFDGTSATATFNVSGLGNEPATAELVVNGIAQYTCTNKGGNAAPGQNPQPATGSSGEQALNSSQKNGRDDVSVTGVLTAPVHIGAKTAGCPGNNWTATLSSLTVTSATLIIRQAGSIVYSQTFPA